MPPIDTDDAPQSIDDLAGLLEGTPGQDREIDAEPEADDQQEHAETESTAPEGETTDDQDTGNEDTSTDPDAEETPDEGETREDAESDTGAPEPLYAVKIDGNEERVNLKELVAGYQRNADYTRKTQKVAESERAFQAAQAEASAKRDQYAQVLQVLQERIGPAEGERTEAQWAELRNSSPAAYATEWADFGRRQDARAKIKAEQDRVAGEQQAESVNKLRATVADQATKLAEKLPVLRDKTKGPEYLKNLRSYAVEQAGFSDEEASKAYDHRILVVLDKARQWDAHQAALKSAQTKLRGARQVPAPAARQPARRPAAAQRDAAQKRFDKSGRIDDAVALI